MIKSIVPTLLVVLSVPFQLLMAAEQFKAGPRQLRHHAAHRFSDVGLRGPRDAPSVGVLDPLKARAVVLDSAANGSRSSASTWAGRRRATRPRPFANASEPPASTTSCSSHRTRTMARSWSWTPGPIRSTIHGQTRPEARRTDPRGGQKPVAGAVGRRQGNATQPQPPIETARRARGPELRSSESKSRRPNRSPIPSTSPPIRRCGRRIVDFPPITSAPWQRWWRRRRESPCLFLQGAAGDLSPQQPAGVRARRSSVEPSERGTGPGEDDPLDHPKTPRCVAKRISSSSRGSM